MVIYQVFLVLSIAVTLALVVVKFVFAFLSYNKYKNNKEIQMLFGAFLLFIFLAIGRILMMIFDYILTQFDPNLLQTYSIFWKIANLFTWFGFLSFIYISEKAIFAGKTRYLITIFYIVFIIISLIPIDFLLVQALAGIPTGSALLFIPISYLYLAKKSAGYPRKKSIIIFTGFVIYLLIGYFLLAEGVTIFFVNITHFNTLIIKYIIHITSAAIKIGGIYLLYYGFIKQDNQ
ncbi:MAG: hypothetical protein EAX96_12745 [Candidatus Lokiarchaeota archaeon]|nr:hypothetical protein [Candidatus Lokiarchaeota archaeon]